MANEIIDITRYLKREPAADMPRGSMALWGAEGERSRFALPLWRIIFLAEADRGMVVWSEAGGHRAQTPFVVLDLGADPARTDVNPTMVPRFGVDESPSLVDLESEGLVVYLGSRRGRVWSLIADGGEGRESPLAAGAREDILFLAGECAGLLFLRDLAAEVDPADEEE
jgi:hypothetical protein